MRLVAGTVLFLGIAAAVAFAAQPANNPAARPADKPAPKSAAPAACDGCREKGSPIDPATLSDEDAASRPAYAAAKRYPETIDKIHCYCGCEDSPNLHHKSLLTCFTTLHATGCEICRGEAELAGKMKSEGSADEDVKKVVEAFYQDRSQ
jgi:hypothetical protein